MKTTLFIFFFWPSLIAISQEEKIVPYQVKLDLGLDIYIRIMHTADSLVESYKEAPFNFEKEDGTCCDDGLVVIRGFYHLALEQTPNDPDALTSIASVEELMMLQSEEEIKAQYAKVVATADKYFEEGNYSKAQSLYQRALNLNPGDKEVKKKLKLAKKKAKKKGSF